MKAAVSLFGNNDFRHWFFFCSALYLHFMSRFFDSPVLLSFCSFFCSFPKSWSPSSGIPFSSGNFWWFDQLSVLKCSKKSSTGYETPPTCYYRPNVADLLRRGRKVGGRLRLWSVCTVTGSARYGSKALVFFSFDFRRPGWTGSALLHIISKLITFVPWLASRSSKFGRFLVNACDS